MLQITGVLVEHPISRQVDGELKDGETPKATDTVNDQASTVNITDCDKLLFSVFSLLQRLGADERPEVRLLVLEMDSTFLFVI